MANPTQAEIETQLKNAVDLIEEVRKFGSVNAKNFVAMQDAYIQSIESDFAADALRSIDAARSGLAGLLLARAAILLPVIRAEGKRIDAPETDVLGILDRIFRDFVDNARSVKTRAFTFGTPVAAAGNVGTGTLIRLNKDESNFDIENQTPDTKRIFCTSDANSGSSRNGESFQIRGGFSGIDALEVEGVGTTGTIEAASSVDSPLDNSGFDSITNTEAAPTSIPGWTVTTTAGAPLAVNSTNFSFDSTNIYLPAPDGLTTVRALNIKAFDARLEQKLVDKGIDLNFARPHYLRVAFNRQVGLADGTLRIRLGSQTASVVLAAQLGWQTLSLPIDTNLWLRNFNTENPTVRVERLSGTTGQLLVDDVVLTTFDPFNGGWYLLLAGQTPFLRRDEFTWTDTAVDSKIQRAIVEGFGIYLPSAAVPTIADP